MASNTPSFVNYQAELRTRARRLGIHPAPRLHAQALDKQDGSRVLYRGQASMLGKKLETRDLYHTAKEARNRVSLRALDFLEGWKERRKLGFDDGLSLAGSFPSDHVVLSQDPEDYRRDSVTKKNACVDVSVLVKQSAKLVAIKP